MKDMLVFVDTASDKSTVTLPPTFEGRYVKANLLYWDLTAAGFTGPYFQIKFSDGLRSDVISTVASGCIPIPSTPPNISGRFTIPLSVGRVVDQRFTLEVLDDASAPLAALSRLLLWFDIVTVPDTPISFS